MSKVGITMHAWEYRQKWYGEEAKVAKARARGLGKKTPSAEQHEN